MTVGTFDRRQALLLAIGVILILVLRFWVYGDRGTQVVTPADSIPAAEKRLERLRELASTVPGREALLKQASAELGVREKGIITADTTAQAQAQLLDVIHRIAGESGFDARGAEQLGEAKPLGNDYGVVTVTETFSCAIEQLVNFLAALANEPLILSTNEIHIVGTADRKKTLRVRLSLSGVVPRKLVPVKKAGSL